MIMDEQVERAEAAYAKQVGRPHRHYKNVMRIALEAAQIPSVTVAEDPVREAADNVLIHLSVGGHVSAGSPAINRLREALAQPVPPSLTEDERKVLLYALNPIGTPKPNIDDMQKTVKSAREKLS